MQKYDCLKHNWYCLNNYSVCSVRMNDIMFIREWRNAQIDVLRQVRPLSEKDQISYYENEIFPSFMFAEPKQLLFSYFHNEIFIGYGGLVHINWQDKRAELSFLVDPLRVAKEEIYTSDFSNFIELMKFVVYNDLKFNRIFTETWNIRSLHISILESCGFLLEGVLVEHCIIKDKKIDAFIHGHLQNYYNKEKTKAISVK